ncbi:unnamed protein product [Tuber aestivum]|uniref:Uncharacterized protein n=1 Tax=Tuber aestivum TaxID=59557 RepID=A0A292Q7L8_9PEZI|nr:unnamed protein product [Tuber aestivum]
MALYYSTTHSPRRLSERRGIPELQPLEPAASPKALISSRVSLDSELCRPISQGSSVISTPYSSYETGSNTAMTTPITPTDISPFKPHAPDIMSPITAPPSIREEDEEDDELCDCSCGSTVNGLGGLGLETLVDGASGWTTARSLSERLHLTTGGNPSFDHDYLIHQFQKSHINGEQYSMPPTPPSHSGEQEFDFSIADSPILRPHRSGELVIDPECFSSGPPSLPQSPSSEGGSGRSRAATILNKIVPKIRTSLKRRMSSPNNTPQVPSIPSASTMPTSPSCCSPGTPPEDHLEHFFRELRGPIEKPLAGDDGMSIHSAAEAEAPLPPLLHPTTTFVGETDIVSPLQSPRFLNTPNFSGADVFPEMCNSPIPPELVCSPLHPPTISPLMSPSLASTSQTSLSMPAPSMTHKKVPSIDPATPLAPKKLASPVTFVTANSLADMIEEMSRDLAAYDATRARMIESGWSSAQEIRNVELQREDKERNWKHRIAESKKILEAVRRSEVKHSAMSSVSSIDSLGGSYPPPTSNPISPIIPVTILPGGDGHSMKGSERTLSK